MQGQLNRVSHKQLQITWCNYRSLSSLILSSLTSDQCLAKLFSLSYYHDFQYLKKHCNILRLSNSLNLGSFALRPGEALAMVVTNRLWSVSAAKWERPVWVMSTCHRCTTDMLHVTASVSTVSNWQTDTVTQHTVTQLLTVSSQRQVVLDALLSDHVRMLKYEFSEMLRCDWLLRQQRVYCCQRLFTILSNTHTHIHTHAYTHTYTVHCSVHCTDKDISNG